MADPVTSGINPIEVGEGKDKRIEFKIITEKELGIHHGR